MQGIEGVLWLVTLCPNDCCRILLKFSSTDSTCPYMVSSLVIVFLNGTRYYVLHNERVINLTANKFQKLLKTLFKLLLILFFSI